MVLLNSPLGLSLLSIQGNMGDRLHRAWAIAEKLPESLLLKEESVMLAKAR
jgi:hypothetical protein